MKATLPTNYQDDILNVSTEGKRKYRMNYNDDGTVSFVDVTPYDQEGSDYGAGDINATNEAVNESFDKNKLIRDMDAISALTEEGYAPDALALKDVNDSLGGVSQFIVDETTGQITGYKTEIGGADTVFPFSSFKNEKKTITVNIPYSNYADTGINVNDAKLMIVSALFDNYKDYYYDSFFVYDKQLYTMNLHSMNVKVENDKIFVGQGSSAKTEPITFDIYT